MKVAMPRANQLYHRLKVLSPLAKPRSRGRAHLVSRRPTSPFAESFRLLALNMRVLLSESPSKGVVIMSAYPRDGRSFVAANLAIALAEESPVLLVDSDRPEDSRLAQLLLAKGNGSDDRLPLALRNATLATEHPGVWLLTRPRPAFNGASDGLGVIVSDSSEAGFFTVVDSPPALTSSSAFVLARQVGQVVYVVRRRVQDMEIHRRIRKQLDRLNVEIIGLVINEG